MGLFDMFFRDTIRSTTSAVASNAVIDEFDNLGARIGNWALVEHNEDGTHNVRPSGFDFIPIGGITMWGGSSAPDGWLICNGAQVSRTTYQTLFTIIGTTYGVGDGSTTFNLPDLQQRFPLGKAAAGTGSTLGATGGTIDHTHSVPAISAHSHTFSASPTTSSDGSHDHGGSTGSGGSHNHTGSTSSDGGHTHSYSGTTSDGSNVTDFAGTSGSVFSSDAGHTHSYSGNTSSDGSHSHSFTTSTDGSHSHSISSGGSHTHSVSVSGTTSSDGASGSSTSGTANPPFQVVNFIILSGV